MAEPEAKRPTGEPAGAGGAGGTTPSPLTLGTAGHIDHGKTTLVAALTGTDTDRLEEERRRGISIELGFAELELPSGRTVSIVDVPGHQRLVRAMVAGASGIDAFLLVIAADDGVMPQTREHWRALRALGIDRGAVALTKVDTAPREARELARAEAAELAPGIPLVEVSARTGEGIERLRRTLDEVATAAGRRSHPAASPISCSLDEQGRGFAGPPRPATPVMHLDRVFTLHGIGTVVTGTLREGPVRAGERLRLLPSERLVRVRSVESHGTRLEAAEPGRRVAVNLTGVGRDEVRRGDVLVAPDSAAAPSYRLDVRLALAPGSGPPPRRVQVHHGTRQAAARVVALDGDGLAQLRLEAPLIALPGDRFVLRRIAPPDTLGGGTVIDPRPARHGPGPATEALRRREAGAPSEEAPASPATPATEPNGAESEPPIDALAARVLALLDADRLTPRGPGALAEELGVERDAVEERLVRLRAGGHLIGLRDDVDYPAARLARITELATQLARRRGEITLAELRDGLRISRKYARAIVEHLDRSGITVRHGDRHVLRRPE